MRKVLLVGALLVLGAPVGLVAGGPALMRQFIRQAEGPTPLSHALAAYQAGDADAFAKAHAEADAAWSAIKADGAKDPCLLTTQHAMEAQADLIRIQTLDRPIVFSMQGDARFLYAVNVANEPTIKAELPVGRPATGNCEFRLQTTAPFELTHMIGRDRARSDLLLAWKASLEQDAGGAMDVRMANAAKLLEAHGMEVQWPLTVDQFHDPFPKDAG